MPAQARRPQAAGAPPCVWGGAHLLVAQDEGERHVRGHAEDAGRRAPKEQLAEERLEEVHERLHNHGITNRGVPRGGFIPAETLVLNGDNGTAGGTLNQPGESFTLRG